MKLSALTVCVGYNDLLEKSLSLWCRGVDRLVIVTTPTDEATLEMCKRWGISYHETDAFYRDGAAFNKGLAISEAVEACHWMEDWQLLFDADMVPPPNWREIVEAAKPEPGILYGAIRQLESGERLDDRNEIPGYFQLFHASDPNVQRKPLLDCSWRHGGGYDSEFHQRWSWNKNKHRLPLELIHQGPTGRNWWGMGNTEAMDKMLEDRKILRRVADYERFT